MNTLSLISTRPQNARVKTLSSERLSATNTPASHLRVLPMRTPFASPKNARVASPATPIPERLPSAATSTHTVFPSSLNPRSEQSASMRQVGFPLLSVCCVRSDSKLAGRVRGLMVPASNHPAVVPSIPFYDTAFLDESSPYTDLLNPARSGELSSNSSAYERGW